MRACPSSERGQSHSAVQADTHTRIRIPVRQPNSNNTIDSTVTACSNIANVLRAAAYTIRHRHSGPLLWSAGSREGEGSEGHWQLLALL